MDNFAFRIHENRILSAKLIKLSLGYPKILCTFACVYINCTKTYSSYDER